MKKTFLFYAKGYVHHVDTSNSYCDQKSTELRIKGTTPEIYEKMKEVSELLEDDEMVFVIKESYFDKCIEESYVQPALKWRGLRDDGKVVINGHLFALYMLLSALIPVAVFFSMLKN